MFIEKFAVPSFRLGYTVSQGLAEEFRKQYQRDYLVIRNLPVLINDSPVKMEQKFLLYQGAVNEGRGFEYLIPAMKAVNYPLVICGDGNFMEKLKKLISENKVEEKIELKGMMLPHELRKTALEATLGIGLAEKEGINQFILIGENVFNFHGSDDSYYEEWFEEVEEGWIAAICFPDFVLSEMKNFNLDYYINFGGTLENINWRTLEPQVLFNRIDSLIQKRLG